MWNIFGDGPLEWSEDADAALYARIDGPLAWQQHAPVSYTHLTLPTIPLV